MLSILHIAAQSTTNSPGLISGLDPPTFNLDFEALKNLKVTLEKARGNTTKTQEKVTHFNQKTTKQTILQQRNVEIDQP